MSLSCLEQVASGASKEGGICTLLGSETFPGRRRNGKDMVDKDMLTSSCFVEPSTVGDSVRAFFDLEEDASSDAFLFAAGGISEHIHFESSPLTLHNYRCHDTSQGISLTTAYIWKVK